MPPLETGPPGRYPGLGVPPAGPVVHVIPTAVARGAQVYARALADELDSPAERHLLLCLFDEGDDVRVDERLGARAGGSAGVGWDRRVAARLRARVRLLAPRAVVAHGGDALKYALSVRRSCPVVYLAIGTLAAPARRGIRRQLWRAMVRRATAVAAVSEDVAAECRSVLGVDDGRLVVIPNGRDPARFHPPAIPRPHETTPSVVFVGRMVEGKRPERFVRVIGELRARGMDLHASAIGDGPLRPAIEDVARGAEVALPGPSDDIAEALRGADLLVFTSTPDGEGMPGVLIEAGLSGLPVVATAVPGVRDVVADGITGMVVPIDDFDALVDATAALVVDADRRSAMGDAARARCNELFTMRAGAARWQDLLGRLAPAR